MATRSELEIEAALERARRDRGKPAVDGAQFFGVRVKRKPAPRRRLSFGEVTLAELERRGLR